MACMTVVNSRMATHEAIKRKMDTQSTADFFTREDRTELIKQGVKLDVLLDRAEQSERTSKEISEGHERRIRVLEEQRTVILACKESAEKHDRSIRELQDQRPAILVAKELAEKHDKSIRQLEDGSLALQVSWKWIVFLASTISGLVSWGMHLLWK